MARRPARPRRFAPFKRLKLHLAGRPQTRTATGFALPRLHFCTSGSECNGLKACPADSSGRPGGRRLTAGLPRRGFFCDKQSRLAPPPTGRKRGDGHVPEPDVDAAAGDLLGRLPLSRAWVSVPGSAVWGSVVHPLASPAITSNRNPDSAKRCGRASSAAGDDRRVKGCVWCANPGSGTIAAGCAKPVGCRLSPRRRLPAWPAGP